MVNRGYPWTREMMRRSSKKKRNDDHNVLLGQMMLNIVNLEQDDYSQYWGTYFDPPPPPQKKHVFSHQTLVFEKPVFHQKWGLGIFLTLGSEPARKISPLASNMSPWGLTATHFVKMLYIKQDFWPKSDRAQTKTPNYIPDPLPKKCRKLIKSIIVSFFWHLDPTFSWDNLRFHPISIPNEHTRVDLYTFFPSNIKRTILPKKTNWSRW